MDRSRPSLDQWLKEAKADPCADQCGMYLFHNGTVRKSARAAVRQGRPDAAPVSGMIFDYDEESVSRAIEDARRMPGIHYVRVWLARGKLPLGADIMLVLVGGDIRPHVIDALQALVGTLKNECVSEMEIREERT